jgi:large subunit ribosomal protein L32
MPNPKRQHSRSRQRKRRTHYKTTVPSSVDLSSGGSQFGVMHRVDPITGYYKGKQVLAIKQKKQKADEASS